MEDAVEVAHYVLRKAKTRGGLQKKGKKGKKSKKGDKLRVRFQIRGAEFRFVI
jgi:hypothetical protein